MAICSCCFLVIRASFEDDQCFVDLGVLYASMSLFAIMEHPSLSQSSSTFAINVPGRLLTCLAIFPRLLLLIRACYDVVFAMSSFYAMYSSWVYT